MKEIAKLKAKEERQRLESEVSGAYWDSQTYTDPPFYPNLI